MNAEQRFSLLVMKVKYYKNQLAFDVIENYRYSLEYDKKQLLQYYAILKNICIMKNLVSPKVYLL